MTTQEIRVTSVFGNVAARTVAEMSDTVGLAPASYKLETSVAVNTARMNVKNKRIIVVGLLSSLNASSIAFSALSIAAFLSGNTPIALGALGPAIAGLVGSTEFIRRLVFAKSGR